MVAWWGGLDCRYRLVCILTSASLWLLPIRTSGISGLYSQWDFGHRVPGQSVVDAHFTTHWVNPKQILQCNFCELFSLCVIPVPCPTNVILWWQKQVAPEYRHIYAAAQTILQYLVTLFWGNTWCCQSLSILTLYRFASVMSWSLLVQASVGSIKAYSMLASRSGSNAVIVMTGEPGARSDCIETEQWHKEVQSNTVKAEFPASHQGVVFIVMISNCRLVLLLYNIQLQNRE